MANYNLIFQGKIIDGASLSEVKKNISRLFKADAAKTEILFSGKTIVIKKNLDTESAKKYLAIIKKAGAVVKAVKIKNIEKPSPAPVIPPKKTAEKVPEKASEKSPEINSTAASENNLSAGLASLVNYNNNNTHTAPVATDSTDEQTGLQLAPIDSEIPTSPAQHNSIEIPDTSYLSMSEAESGSLEEFAIEVEAIELPDIDSLSMSDANSGSLEEFAVEVEAAELPDISNLDIAAQDNTPLSAQSPKQTSADIPDTSDLSMSEALEGSLEGIEIKPEAIKIPDTSHLEIEKTKEQKALIGKAVFQID